MGTRANPEGNARTLAHEGGARSDRRMDFASTLTPLPFLPLPTALRSACTGILLRKYVSAPGTFLPVGHAGGCAPKIGPKSEASRCPLPRYEYQPAGSMRTRSPSGLGADVGELGEGRFRPLAWHCLTSGLGPSGSAPVPRGRVIGRLSWRPEGFGWAASCRQTGGGRGFQGQGVLAFGSWGPFPGLRVAGS